MRDDETEITDGPFAVTKEILAGYYVLDCADLDEALTQAARLPVARCGSVEVRPIMPAEEWLQRARDAGADVPDEAVERPGVSGSLSRPIRSRPRSRAPSARSARSCWRR